MPSTPSYLYTPAQRANCYDCPSTSRIEARNKVMQLECRMYNKYGLTIETESTISETELFDKRLIDRIEIGVDAAKFSNEKHFEFVVQSRGGGGLSKWECGTDYQIPVLIGHDKLAFTELLYVNAEWCTKTLISTELQDWAFPNGRYDESKVTGVTFSDYIISAARKTISEGVNLNDIIGVFGGVNPMANSYDGILAQAYWAYTLNAYFHSVKFTIDETVLVTGYFLHAKYGGWVIDLEFDSTQVSDPAIERYQTRAEIYARLVELLNTKILMPNGTKYVDASYYQNQITVTSKWTAMAIQLMLTVNADSSVDWKSCGTEIGYTVETLQGVMPVDERPFLVTYRPYTPDNIIKNFAEDIYKAMNDMSAVKLDRGQVWGLYMDKHIWDMYMYALTIPTANNQSASIKEMFTAMNGNVNVFTLDALSQNSGTGLWFITAIDGVGGRRSARNIKHTTDFQGATSPSLFTTPNCKTLEMTYEQLHGVFVWDFRKFAANLLCSPFVANLKTPHANTLPLLPCFNAAVRSSEIDLGQTAGCNINACFQQDGAPFINAARYALPLPAPQVGYAEYVLEDGQSLPAGAFPIWEMHFNDCTTGIAVDDIPSATYEYVVTFSDGQSPVIYTGKDLILSFVGNAAGIAFNITQTVTVGACSDTFDASADIEADYPFVMEGNCTDLDPAFTGRIDLVAYTITSATDFDTAVTVTGAPDATIDLSANPDGGDAAAAAAIIQAYFDANGIAGLAIGSGTSLVVQSPNVVFVNIDPLGTPNLFAKSYELSMFDGTDYDAHDGLASIEVRVYCQGGALPPVNPNFTELPIQESIDNCAGEDGWIIDIIVTTTLGCAFELSATVDSADADAPANQVSFTFA